MVGVTELESVTSTMSTWRSNQLSYTPETNNADPFLHPFSGNGRSPSKGPYSPPREKMVGVTELESVTSTMSTWRSNQLSYTPETHQHFLI